MNKTKTKKLREHYLHIKQQIIESLSKVEELDTDGDEIDQVQGATLQTMSQRLNSREIAKLHKINAALKILENDNSDIDECGECGEIIEEKRLFLIPGVRTCVACAEDAEIKAKKYA